MTTNIPPIGLSGFAGSGKTAAALYLESEYGFTRLHIADTLRGMLRVLLQDLGYDTWQRHEYLEGQWKESIIPELGVTSRHAQITLGTEWGRNLIHDDLWQRCWEARASRLDQPAMNDSVRFPNEEDGIHSRHGFTIMIVRPGRGPAAFKGRRFMKPVWRWLYQTFGIMWGVHPSERVDLLNPDYVVHNTGTLDDLHRMLDQVMDHRDYGKLVEVGPVHVTPETVLRWV